MSKPYAYTRCVMSGHIQTAQTWSTSFAMLFGIPGPSDDDLNAALANLDPLVRAWWLAAPAGPGDQNPADVTLEKIALTFYAAGSSTATAVAERTLTPELSGGSGTMSLPTQTAIVATLRTASPSRSGRGRMYLPCTAAPLDQHELTLAQTNGVATALSTFFSAVNASGEIGLVSVAGKDALRPVVSITVDSETDVQRRRADKLHGLFIDTVGV